MSKKPKAGDIAPAPVQISTKHLTRFENHSISTDGKAVMLVFADGDDKPFGLTMGIEFLPWLRTAAQQALRSIPKPVSTENMIAYESVGAAGDEEVGVALAPQLPDVCIVRMSPDRAEELGFKLSYMTAIKLALVLQSQVGPKLTAGQNAELKQWLKERGVDVDNLPDTARH